MFGLKYPKYLFMTYGFYEPMWWTSQHNDTDDECSSENVAEVLQFSLAVSHFHSPWREMMYYHVCYDATWTLAYALDKVVQDTQLNYTNQNLLWNDNTLRFRCGQLIDKLCRGYDSMYSLLNKYLKFMNFSGVSVSLHYFSL